MGCDIHIALERKIDGEWVYQGNLERVWQHEVDAGEKKWTSPLHKCMSDIDGRDYRFFGRIAGVRTEGPAANGWPEDVSAGTLDALGWGGEDGEPKTDPRENSDLHSHGHHSLEHMLACKYEDDPDRFMAKVREAAGVTLMEKLCGIPREDAIIDNWRVIFAFDN